MAKLKILSVGRRKSAVARVHLKSGKGKFIINNKNMKDYFGRVSQRKSVMQPIESVDFDSKKYDIVVNVRGGGLSGQAGAIRHGVTRALVKLNAEYKSILKSAGFLTRDSREKERKKYGLAGARKAFQFSKR